MNIALGKTCTLPVDRPFVTTDSCATTINRRPNDQQPSPPVASRQHTLNPFSPGGRTVASRDWATTYVASTRFLNTSQRWLLILLLM